jgi:tRNA A-37 threonylcarbamoyl transferase component Bud32/tetratricopeptide (TPR) repeat protein
MTDQPEPKSAPLVKELSGRIGKYEIVRAIGKGAMGMVYLAHDTILERDVALKVMVSQIADDPELIQRFSREAKAVAKMTHPNVVTVFDLGTHIDGSPYIAMELLKGQDLQKAMRTPPPMTLDRKVLIIVQVLAGLAHAHQAGIVHRDIKPANIFINQDGTVKIMDFGVARLTTASMTGTGNIVGTADYMSPEQVKGAKVDGRSDLFSVGCMLYELLAGRRPFHSDNLMAIFYKITHEEVNYGLLPQGPDYDALSPILQRALAKRLEDRYQTAYDFAVALREYLKAWATGGGGDHALEQLVDLEPPPSSPPQPLTDAPGATLVPADEGDIPSATMDLGRPGGKTQAPTAARSGTGTVRGAGPTVVAGGTRTASGTRTPTVLSSTAQRGPATRMEPTVVRREPAPSGGSPVLYAVLGAMALALVGAAGYIYLNRQEAKTTEATVPVSTTLATVTSVPPSTTLAVAPPTPTLAPIPTLPKGPTRSDAMKAAQAAFAHNDYDQAITQAQKALAADPGDAQARALVENALKGQQAEARFASAETALRQGQLDRAMSEAEAGYAVARWDPRGPGLIGRIQQAKQRAEQAAAQQAQQRAQQQRAAQVTGLLGQADAALSAANYDEAIRGFDEVLKLDGQNQRAIMGKSTAVQARALAAASSGGGGGRGAGAPGRSFVSAKTTAQSAETRSSGSVPEGFEDTPGVVAKKGSQAAELPGKIVFDIDPEAVKPGEYYTVKIYLLNEGNAPIQVREMLVTPKINGKGVTAPVAAQTKDVAPQQRALLLNTRDIWRQDISAWSMEVTVRTVRGETYKNQVTWK